MATCKRFPRFEVRGTIGRDPVEGRVGDRRRRGADRCRIARTARFYSNTVTATRQSPCCASVLYSCTRHSARVAANCSMNAATAGRVLDLGLEDGDVLSPLAGLFPPDLPVPSLAEALAQVSAELKHLDPKTGRSVKLALKHAKKVLKKHPDLTADEVASIVLYTMEEVPRSISLYFALNGSLREKDREKVKPWRDYIWLLMHALRKLPTLPARTVFRGAKLTPTQLNMDLDSASLPEVGFEFTWGGFSSTALTQGVMSTFVGTDGPRTMLTIELTEKVARKISDFSLFPNEDEVLLPPNVCLEVVSRFDAGHGLTMVQCKQTETIDPILDLSNSPILDLSSGEGGDEAAESTTTAADTTATAAPLNQLLPKGSPAFERVSNLVKGSPMPFESRCRAVVLSVTQVATEPAGAELQFHGTPSPDLVIKSGFKLPSHEAPPGSLGRAIYFSRSAVTAFWHSAPHFASTRESATSAVRTATGKVLLCAVRTGRSKELTSHSPDTTRQALAAKGFDSATIVAAELWPSALVDDETAIFAADACTPVFVVELQVTFDHDKGSVSAAVRSLYGSSLFTDAVTAAANPQILSQAIELRRRMCNPVLKTVHFEEWGPTQGALVADALMARTTMLNGLYYTTHGEHLGALQSFAEALRSNCKLRMLQITLRGNINITVRRADGSKATLPSDPEDAVVMLCRGLETNTNLHELRLAGYRARNGSRGTTALCTLIEQKSTLQHLSLKDTESPPSSILGAIQKRTQPLAVLYGKQTQERCIGGLTACGFHRDIGAMARDHWSYGVTTHPEGHNAHTGIRLVDGDDV